jgi:hypothetical protein
LLRANFNDRPSLAHCDFSWTEVGKIGLGSVVIDPQDENLYTVNLFDKRLHRLPLGQGAAAAAARRHDPATRIPNPNCPGGTTNWRPFRAAFDRVNEQLYVGGVCSAETSEMRADLRAVIYRVDNPRSAAPSFVPVLNFPLNYERAPNPALAGVTGARTTQLNYCRAPNYCRWNPWPTVTSTGGRAPITTQDGVTINEQNNPSFPQLTAITFAEDGSMILGLRDLIGDMGGVNAPGEIGPASGQGGLGPMEHGDMLRAGGNSDGTFTLEQGGRVTFNGQVRITSNGRNPNLFNPITWDPINWGYGPGIGPGGGYFYNPGAAQHAAAAAGDGG